MSTGRMVVLGAGYVGAAVAQEARLAGHDVWAVRRSALPGVDGDGVHWLRGDVAAGEVTGLPERLDTVVLTVSPGRSTDDYDSIYPPAARGAVQLARRSGARRLVYTSSTGVYGGRDGAEVTEESERRGSGASSTALLQAEDVMLAAHDVRACVLRVAGIYGPGRDPRPRYRNASALSAHGMYWVNLAHREDIVRAVLHVLALETVPSVLNVSDGHPARAAEICRWLAVQEQRDAPLDFTNASAPVRSDQRVSNAALVATGWTARYPSFREGFAGPL